MAIKQPVPAPFIAEMGEKKYDRITFLLLLLSKLHLSSSLCIKKKKWSSFHVNYTIRTKELQGQLDTKNF